MSRFLVPIDYELAERVLSADAVEEMRHFDVKLIDVASWHEEKHAAPCISSLFSFSRGGSFDIDDEKYGQRFVHNGTLVGTADNSERYYAAWLAQQGRVDVPDRVKQRDGEGVVITFHIADSVNK